MSYCRFLEGDVYVYLSVGGYLECCACSLMEEEVFSFTAKNTGDMVKHLWEHQNKGHYVPEHTFDDLWLDHEENMEFINEQV